MADVTDPAGSLRVVDFGRTRPYIDPRTGVHIPPSPSVALSRVLNPLMLSPFELKGSPLSRRDDMYRVSELLFNLMGHALEVAGRSAKIAAEKEKWTIDDELTEFNEFHHAMVALGFTDRPEYEAWIARFTELTYLHSKIIE